MNKKLVIVLLLLLIYIIGFVSAVDVTNINNANTISDAQTIASIKAELGSQIQAVNTKLDGFATKQEVLNLLQAHLIKVDQIQEQFRASLVVNIVLIGFALIGLFYGVYFNFKSKGRL
jgi:hypothetical protein